MRETFKLFIVSITNIQIKITVRCYFHAHITSKKSKANSTQWCRDDLKDPQSQTNWGKTPLPFQKAGSVWKPKALLLTVKKRHFISRTGMLWFLLSASYDLGSSALSVSHGAQPDNNHCSSRLLLFMYISIRTTQNE